MQLAPPPARPPPPPPSRPQPPTPPPGADPFNHPPTHSPLLQAFFFDVVSKAEALACKHQLAVRLAEALGKARTSTLGDLALADLLQA